MQKERDKVKVKIIAFRDRNQCLFDLHNSNINLLAIRHFTMNNGNTLLSAKMIECL